MDAESKQELKNWIEWFRNFKYKPNFSWILETGMPHGWPFVTFVMKVPDSRFVPEFEGQPVPEATIRQKVILGPWNGEQYAQDFVRSTIRHIEDHEIDEWFRYKGDLIFDPHKENS